LKVLLTDAGAIGKDSILLYIVFADSTNTKLLDTELNITQLAKQYILGKM